MPDKNSIITILSEYFRILHEGDASAAQRLFHPQCTLFCPTDAETQSIPLNNYLDVLRTRRSPKANGEPLYGKILTIDQSGPATALAKVYSAVQPKYYVDYLTLVADPSGWHIVSKVYRELPGSVAAVES